MQETGAMPVLAVDLDGTLIRSDMLHETFWSGFARDWRTPLHALAGLAQGKASLKARLAALAPPDPATLPYVPEVLDHIRDWRARGGRTALVTAADSRVAQAVAGHLALFDEVHASDGTVNLKGGAKADLLVRLYGERGFVYMGDHPADLKVWRHAAGAVTVGAAPALRAQAQAIHPDALHLAPPAPVLPAALKAMRPHQWAKNLLVFFPLVAAHDYSMAGFLMALAAFVAFSLVASSVYLLNDLLDLAADRAHPRKCRRPLASGALPLATGMALIPALLAVGLAISLALPAVFLGVLATYYLLTIAYSLWLKRRAIVDICALASLYTLRIVAGGAATDITLSVWLLAMSVFLFFALAAVKRQAELVDLVNRGIDEVAGRGYRRSDLPVVTQMAVSAGFASVLVLMLYLNEPTTREMYPQPLFLWAACLVLLYWVSRMVLIASRGGMHDDPVVFAARDRVSQMVLVLVAALVLAAGWA